MNVYLRAFLLAPLIIFSVGLSAQKASVKADKYRMRIGEKVNLQLEAELNKGQEIIWPTVLDSIGPYFDVLDKSKIDTIEPTAGKFRFTQQIAITSFDSGMHTMPVFDFLFITPGKDSLSIVSDPLSIQVLNVPVDTTAAIKDIRNVVDVPQDYSEYIPWAIAALIAIALFGAAVYFWSQRKKPAPVTVVKTPAEPAWKKAMRELERIGHEKVWQQEKTKVYHSEISDTLRTYIEEQWLVPALESTTYDIIRVLSMDSTFKPEDIFKLKTILELADLVKFAKENPDAFLNERSLKIAKEFVEQTIPKPSPAVEKKEVKNG